MHKRTSLMMIGMVVAALAFAGCKKDDTNSDPDAAVGLDVNVNQDSAVSDAAMDAEVIVDSGADAATFCATSLTTQYNTARTGLDGIMFDVTATNNATITGIDVNLLTGFTHDVSVYWKVGTHTTSVTNASAWTLEATAANVTSLGDGVATPLAVPINIQIQAGQTIGLYITASDSDPGDSFGIGFVAGTALGAVATSDTNLEILNGQGVTYPFTQTAAAPRIWDGTLHYDAPGTCP